MTSKRTAKHDHNGIYERKETCSTRHGGLNERCVTRAANCDAQFKLCARECEENRKEINKIKWWIIGGIGGMVVSTITTQVILKLLGL